MTSRIESVVPENPVLFEGTEVAYSMRFLGAWGIWTSGTRISVSDDSYKLSHEVNGLQPSQEGKPLPDGEKAQLKDLIRNYQTAAEKGDIMPSYPGLRTSDSIEYAIVVGPHKTTFVCTGTARRKMPDEIEALVSFFGPKTL